MTRAGANKNLALATVSFAVSFALWGLISGLAPIFKTELKLTAFDSFLMVAIPVLLGSVGRIPLGLLTERYGGRMVFSVLLMFGLIPTVALAVNHSYQSLLIWGFLLGLMGTSFAIGVGFSSPWFPAEKQGLALGIFGAGNIGQSIAVFGGPLLAVSIGISSTFLWFGIASLLWGVVFLLWARNVPRTAPPKTMGENVRVLREEPMAWVLSLFYFLTFGGFVAFGNFLPTLLKDYFQIPVADAGARTAVFVLLATAMRPVGGWLADRISGQLLLRFVFVALVAFGSLLVFPSIEAFTVGALGCAACLGLGNGGVFKLVPRFFPKQTGTVTGLVGAAGGLGGFFPPLLLGWFRDSTGSYTPGFVMLCLVAVICAVVLWVLPAFRLRSSAVLPNAASEA